MKQSQLYQAESFNRTEAFIAVHADVVGSLRDTEAGVQLHDANAQLAAHVVEQSAADRDRAGHGNRHRQLVVALREQHMKPIVTFARASLRGVPGFKALSRLPVHLSGQALVNTARGMATAAAPYEADFTRAQLAPDTVDQLVQATNALESALSARKDAERRRIGATAGIKEQVARARSAVAMLDPIVMQKLRGNAQLLAEWRSAKRARSMPSAPASPPVAVGPSAAPIAPVAASPSSADPAQRAA